MARPEELGGGTFKVSHFFDTKKEYIQHCPLGLFSSIAKNPADSPILGPNGPRECLVKARRIYRGQAQWEVFKNSEEKRRRVKFGLLIGYAREKH